MSVFRQVDFRTGGRFGAPTGATALKLGGLDGSKSAQEDQKTISAPDVRAALVAADPSNPPIFRNVRIAGHLDLSGQALTVPLRFEACVFENDLRFSSARIPLVDLTACVMQLVIGDDCRIEGSLRCADGFVANAACSFKGATIGGSVHFSTACLKGSPVGPLETQALDFSDAEIGGACFLNRGFRATGQIRFRGARIGSKLDLLDAKLSHDGNGTLACDGLRIGGPVTLGPGFSCIGRVNFKGAKIAGGFYAAGCSISNGTFTDGNIMFVDDAIDLSFTQIGQKLSIESCRVGGGIRLVGAELSGDLNFAGSQVQGIDPQRSKPADGVRLDYAIAARRMRVDGTVFFTQKFRAEGSVDFSDTKIGGGFRCIGATFSNNAGLSKFEHHKSALDLTDAHVGGTLVIRQPLPERSFEFGETRFTGDIKFARLQANSFVDDDRCWPKHGHIELAGFTYNILQEAHTDKTFGNDRTLQRRQHRRPIVSIRLRWLQRQPAKDLDDEFQLQPWFQLSQSFRRMGDAAGARQVSIARQEALLRSRSLPWARRLWLKFLKYTAGHGYSPVLPIYWCLVFVLLGALAAHSAHSAGAFSPAAPVVLVERENQDLPNWTPQGYPVLMPFWYSVDTFVPLLDLGQEAHWLPNGEGNAEAVATIPAPVKHAVQFTTFLNWLIGDFWQHIPAQVWQILAQVQAVLFGFLEFFLQNFPRFQRAFKLLGWLMVTLAVATISGIFKDDNAS